jgi:ribonuclease P protein component
MPKQFTLGKNERLKSRKQIEQLFNDGKSFAVTPFKVYYAIHKQFREPRSIPAQRSFGKDGSGVRFGVGVPGKNFKKAVDRNRIKRLMREAWRLQKNELNEKLKAAGLQMNVFFIYTGKGLPDFETVKEKGAVALKKLSEKINENTASDS